MPTKLVIGADGARSNVAKTEVPGGDKIPYVIAYHEIIKAPAASNSYDPGRCDVIYDGKIIARFLWLGVSAWRTLLGRAWAPGLTGLT